MAPDVAAVGGPTPWPAAQKAGGKKGATEYIKDVLEDTPINAAQVLVPTDDTESGIQGTEAEQAMSASAISSGPLRADLCDIMDMTATDNDGDMLQDNTMGFAIVKKNDRITRRQRQQGKEEEEKRGKREEQIKTAGPEHCTPATL